MGARDIVKVVVERNGVVVAPLLNGLTPTPFSNKMGATTSLHAGILLYPCSAFTADAAFTITAIPEQGDNIIKKLSLGELRSLR